MAVRIQPNLCQRPFSDQLSVAAKFDIDRLAEKVKSSRVRDDETDYLSNDHLKKYFAPTALGVIEHPSTVVDEHGRVILWYLPDIIAPFRVVGANLCHPLKHV